MMIIRIKLSIFPLIIIIYLLNYYYYYYPHLPIYTMLLTTGPCCNKFLAHLPQPEQKEKKKSDLRTCLFRQQAGYASYLPTLVEPMPFFRFQDLEMPPILPPLHIPFTFPSSPFTSSVRSLLSLPLLNPPFPLADLGGCQLIHALAFYLMDCK